MVEESGMHPLSPWARTRVVNYLATHFGEDAEEELVTAEIPRD